MVWDFRHKNSWGRARYGDSSRGGGHSLQRYMPPCRGSNGWHMCHTTWDWTFPSLTYHCLGHTPGQDIPCQRCEGGRGSQKWDFSQVLDTSIIWREARWSSFVCSRIITCCYNGKVSGRSLTTRQSDGIWYSMGITDSMPWNKWNGVKYVVVFVDVW